MEAPDRRRRDICVLRTHGSEAGGTELDGGSEAAPPVCEGRNPCLRLRRRSEEGARDPEPINGRSLQGADRFWLAHLEFGRIRPEGRGGGPERRGSGVVYRPPLTGFHLEYGWLDFLE